MVEDYPYELDDKRRKLAKLYSKQQLSLGLVHGVIMPVAFLVIIYVSSLSAHIESSISDILVGTPLESTLILTVLFVIILMSILFILGLPFSYYGGYKLEHDYDLSNQSFGDWLGDQIKSLSISLLFTTPLITGVFYLGRVHTELWWFYAGLALFIMMGVFSNIAHLILLPLFYKTEEMKDDELSNRLKEMAKQNGVKGVEKVIKVHASEKTEKVNAGFAGMGKTKRIYLYDTLLKKFHNKEIECVVAHEMGHYVHHDVPRYVLLEGLVIFPVFFAADKIFRTWASFDNIYHLPFFLLILYGLYSLIDPITLYYSRYREREADAFAIEAVGDSESIISAFKRLADIDLAELKPSKLVEIMFYSHPTPKSRIEMAEEWSEG